MQMEMKGNLEESAASLIAGKSRTKTDSSNDVYLIMKELLAARVFHSEASRTYDSFDNFKDVYERINLPELHSWSTKQKIRASSEIF